MIQQKIRRVAGLGANDIRALDRISAEEDGLNWISTDQLTSWISGPYHITHKVKPNNIIIALGSV